jgi:DNA-binding NarL/FixJ family response regulator
MIRVIAVDHNSVLRTGIVDLISGEPQMEMVGTGSTAEAAVSLFTEQHPDITLLDLDLPAEAAIKATKQILQIEPKAFIIGTVSHHSCMAGEAALEAGAATIIVKDELGRMLGKVIRSRLGK